jgi:hypothetical protein
MGAQRLIAPLQFQQARIRGVQHGLGAGWQAQRLHRFGGDFRRMAPAVLRGPHHRRVERPQRIIEPFYQD